jgi:hypothetical protein
MRLVEDSSWQYTDSPEEAARRLWRILHCWPVLATGHIHDLCDRLYAVESTRVFNKRWIVNLKAMTCCDQNGECCPQQMFNKTPRCCHVQAALVKEKQLLTRNVGNALIFPDRRKRIDPEPPERKSA